MTQKILIHPSDRLVDSRGYDIQIQPIIEPDPHWSAYRQSLQGPNVLLWVGGKTNEVYRNFPFLLNAARQYKNIKSVYLFDEMFNLDGTIQIGLYENEILDSAYRARAIGLETVISISAEVIFHPNFKMRDINSYNIIAIEIYPSFTAMNLNTGYTFDNNIYSTLLFASYMRLREHGYGGKIGYLAQGFCAWGASYDDMLQKLTRQKETMNRAISMKVDWACYWGCALGSAELSREPWIMPLGESSLAPLIRFD